MRAILLLGLVLTGCAETQPSSELPGSTPLPPWPKVEDAFVFRFRGVPEEVVAKARTHPSYKIQDLPDGGVQVEWDPKVPKDWVALRERYGGKHYPDFLYDMMVIPGELGKTIYSHGGLGTNGWGGVVFIDVKHWLNAGIVFNDAVTGIADMMILGAIGPGPAEIQHEMLRHFPGTRISVERCGDGYVVVSKARRGMMVCWQINEQAFALVGDCYDKDMVAAYVNRLGSLIPKDFKVDSNEWVKDEIVCRTKQIDSYITHSGWDGPSMDGVWRDITGNFHNVYEMKGFIGREKTPKQYHDNFQWVRQWLWANKDNFKYDDETRGFILKGPDRYDPAHPPELPEEMTHLPPPDYQLPAAPRKDAP